MKHAILRSTFAAASLLVLFTGSASAQDDFWGGLSATITGVSDYRFRGISQTANDPAIQGSVDWSGPDNFYLGMWASNIDFQDGGVTSHGDSRIEWDIYGGKHFALDDATDLNLEAIYYAYPDYDPLPGAPRYSYFEGIAQIGHSWDAFSLKGTFAWSPDFFGETGNGFYVAGGAAYQFNDWITASANVGEQWIDDLNDIPGGGYPYTHWDIGVTFNWNNFALDARYIDTSLSKAQCGSDWCGATGVVSLSYTFGGG